MVSVEPGSSSLPKADAQPSNILTNNNDQPEEPEDILSGFLGVMYDYAPITHAEAGSTFTYTYSCLVSPVYVDPSPLKGSITHRMISGQINLMLHTPDTQARNWELHASSIWAASVFLAGRIDELVLEDFARVSASSGCRLAVLEIGAGAGLPGLLAAKCLEKINQGQQDNKQIASSWRVTLSDYPDDILIETLRGNVRRNGFGDEPHPVPFGRGDVCVVPYAWGEEVSAFLSSNDNAELEGFDLIMAADTLWNAGLHDAFAHTLYQLLRHSCNARVHLVAGLHTGRYAISAFLRAVHSVHLSKAYNSGEKVDAHNIRLEVLNITERDVNTGEQRDWKADREGEDDAERRRWIVWIILGWAGL